MRLTYAQVKKDTKRTPPSQKGKGAPIGAPFQARQDVPVWFRYFENSMVPALVMLIQ